MLPDGRVVSTGNFHGAPLGFAADFLAIAAAEVGSISERRVDRLLDVTRSRDLPAFLTPDPGVNSGLMIAQYTAAGIVAENRRLASPASVDSVPTSGMQEDHVSMGWAAARKLRTVLDNLTSLLAVELIAGVRGIQLRAPLEPSAAGRAALAAVGPFAGTPGPDIFMAPVIEHARVGGRRLRPTSRDRGGHRSTRLSGAPPVGQRAHPGNRLPLPQHRCTVAHNGGVPDAKTRRWYRPMVARDVDEPHRASTPLELLFDLCFVVGVSQAAGRLHHALSANEIGHGIGSYLMVFFAIWWAWVNFTWFASAYDNDDVPYRVTTLVQITGALILAAGVPRAFDANNFMVVVIGYVVMRLAMVGQWLRVSWSDPLRRVTALRFAIGITIVQIGWVLRSIVSDRYLTASFIVLVIAELAVPIYGERAAGTTWHPTHIAERYGLFTLIVLGEAILAATTAIQTGFDAGGERGQLLVLSVSGLVIVFAMWWVYFDRPGEELLRTARSGFFFGYGHYFVVRRRGRRRRRHHRERRHDRRTRQPVAACGRVHRRDSGGDLRRLRVAAPPPAGRADSPVGRLPGRRGAGIDHSAAARAADLHGRHRRGAGRDYDPELRYGE